MILDPTKRRFGYGVARLAIRRPMGGESLSVLARSSAQSEETFAALPTLLCAAVAFMLALTIRMGTLESQPLASVTPTERPSLEIEFWSTANPIRPEPLPFTTASMTTQAMPIPEADSSREPDAPEEALATDSEPAFDAASIAMQALSMPSPNTQPIDIAIPISRARHRATSSGTPRPKLLTAALGSTRPTPRQDLGEPSTPAPNAQERPNSGAGYEPAPSMANLRVSDNGHAFLAARARLNTAGPESPGSNRPPAVSAAGLASTRATDSLVRDEIHRAAYRSDWREVPLDELPDCSPPGRQDLLKKRILLAAPFERECSHQDGSYRFIETRNLGAFLMWSRSNPDRSVGQKRAMNVCDVLERALRCLDGSSIEESSTP